MRSSPKNIDLLVAFSAALKEARRNSQVTQDMLAYQSGISRTTIARIESGKIQPSISVLFHLCDGLGIKPEELIKLTRLQFNKLTE
jgi:DNA-binding XRE family transcriptional regulator